MYHAIAVAWDAVEEDSAPEFVKAGGEVAVGWAFLEEDIEVCHVVRRRSGRSMSGEGGPMARKGGTKGRIYSSSRSFGESRTRS